MCLTIPKRVIAVSEGKAVVENPDGSRQEVLSLIELGIGDFVITQQNIVVEKTDEREAKEIIKMVNSLNK